MVYNRYRFLFLLTIFFYNDIKGQEINCDKTCIELSKCFQTLQRPLMENETYPNMCYFKHNKIFVCCPTDDTITSRLDKNSTLLRISEKKCNEFYPPKKKVNYIFAGFEIERNEFPFTAAIGYGDYNNPVYNCCGFLAEKNFVITAAHCAIYNGVSPSVVRIGGKPLSDNTTKIIRVFKTITHPKYESDTELNDIAILVLGEHAKETPACLWTFGEIKDNNKNNVIATGYGSTSFGGAFAKRLLKVNLTIIDNKVCEKEYITQSILNSQLCVQGNTRILNSEIVVQDTCQGDSGGPLVINNKLFKEPRIIGIVSYGRGCGTEVPGIYTNISSYIDWIESIIWPENNGEEKIIFL